MAITRIEQKRVNRERRAEELRNSAKIVMALTVMVLSVLYLAAIMSGTRILISAIKAIPKGSDDSPVSVDTLVGERFLRRCWLRVP
jgi:hypothetical protein